MCGIVGYLGIQDPSLIHKMTDLLSHRGPDGKGFFQQPGVALGHSRLSIIDLQSGAQPITNEDGTLQLIFNGEIYNYQELRKELIQKGHIFKTSSDTETIIHSYEEYAEECVNKFNGDFSFAIFDTRSRELFLARDRFGIRPLFYTHQKGCFIFASEIKAILSWDPFERRIHHKALSQYLLNRQVSGPDTLFEGIYQLPPAHTLIFKDDKLQIKRYWNLPFAENKTLSHQNIVEEFRSLFEDSVKLRLRSDVPYGAFLSGGIDSSAVVSVMSRFAETQVKTFSIGFGTKEDELEKAKGVAQYLGTHHDSFLISRNAYTRFPEIIRHLDNLVGDAIVLPIFLLAEKTAQKVKVVLTGEGADEILGGYIHQLTMAKSHLISPLIPFLRLTVKTLSPKFLDRFFPYPAALGRKGKKKLIRYLSSWKNKGEAYLNLSTLFDMREESSLFSIDYSKRLQTETQEMIVQIQDHFNSQNGAFLNKIISYDIEHWLPDNILHKQDHLTLAHGLEGRVPFLDHRLVEFCAQLPVACKIKGWNQKVLLREAVMSYLPSEIVRGKKQAFYIPTEKCFDEGFDDFVKDILLSQSFRNRKIFSKDYYDSLDKRLKTNELLENKRMMALLLLELWMREFLDKKSSPVSEIMVSR